MIIVCRCAVVLLCDMVGGTQTEQLTGQQMENSMDKRGFTLIELMIVIAIIAIIAAIAIPNLLDARKAANEADAISFMRSIHSAENLYREQDKDGNGTLDYAGTLNHLFDYGLLKGGEVATGYYYRRAGYRFGHNRPSATHTSLFRWSYIAWPQEQGDSGDRAFFLDQTGVIRYTLNFVSFSTLCDGNWPAIGK